MPTFDVSTVLSGLRHTSPQRVVDALTEAAQPLARDLVLSLVDFEQELLQPLVDGSEMVVPLEEPVSSTLAGRAYQSGEPVVAERDGATRVWVPVFEHSVRTGVLAMTVDDAAPAVLEAHRRLNELEIAERNSPELSTRLSRLFLWSIEFGLLGQPGDSVIVGAAILSSPREAYGVIRHPPRTHSFTLDATNHDILFTEPQQHLFVASSFDTYKDVLDECLETYGSAVPAGHSGPQ